MSDELRSDRLRKETTPEAVIVRFHLACALCLHQTGISSGSTGVVEIELVCREPNHRPDLTVRWAMLMPPNRPGNQIQKVKLSAVRIRLRAYSCSRLSRRCTRISVDTGERRKLVRLPASADSKSPVGLLITPQAEGYPRDISTGSLSSPAADIWAPPYPFGLSGDTLNYSRRGDAPLVSLCKWRRLSERKGTCRVEVSPYG
ncbi:unnamed protein product [Peronospora belbahrii]|uniref:Ig-like domain-containing protein n=1 Tax=Peronospora belbahrii TaxID=622444 RepID=A0AAU9LAN3_9STRA|nr:unnamed protein product [Peronospora belbahrii]